MTIVERIDSLCRAKGITIYRLEKDLGLSQSTIRKWETASPTCTSLLAVANYFDISLDFLTGRTDNPFAHKSERFSIKYMELYYELSQLEISNSEMEKLIKIIKLIVSKWFWSLKTILY